MSADESDDEAQRRARERFDRTVQTADDVCAYVHSVSRSPTEAILALLMAARSLCETQVVNMPLDAYYKTVCDLKLEITTRNRGAPC